MTEPHVGASRKTVTRLARLALVILVTLAAACGDDDSSAQSQEPGGSTSTTLASIQPGSSFPIGEVGEYTFWTHCGIGWLGRFDDAKWHASEEAIGSSIDVPADWEAYVDPSNEDLHLRLERRSADTIIAEPVGAPADVTVIEYKPVEAGEPGCD